MYKKNDKSQLKHFDFFLWDSVMIQASYIISYTLRFGLQNPYRDRSYMGFSIIFGLVYICVVFFSEGYKNILRRGYIQELKCSVHSVTFTIFIMLAYLFLIQNSDFYSRVIILYLWAAAIFFIYIERVIWKSVVRRKLEERSAMRAIVVVSSASLAKDTIHSFLQRDHCDFRITGITLIEDGDYDHSDIAGVPVIGDMEKSIEYFSGNVVDEVFIRIPPGQSLPQEFMSKCLDMGLAIHLNLEQKLETNTYREVQKLGEFTVLTACMNSVTARQMFMKRLIDIIAGLIGIVMTGILTVIIAPVIFIQSPGPIFFRQERVGRGGRIFNIYKFRSMYMDAEEKKISLMPENQMDGPIFKVENDPRVFPFGRVLRKWSIDEFPQFFNILKGEMSLVGTRPPTVDEYEQYESHHKKRLSVKPGLTGLWQISGRNDIVNFEEIVRLDSEYINNWRLGLDLKIICRTVLVVLRRKGAR